MPGKSFVTGREFLWPHTCALQPHTNIKRIVLDELLWHVVGTKTSCCVAEDKRKPTKVTEPSESVAPCELFTKTRGNPSVFLSIFSSASSTYLVFLLFTTQFSASCLASWNWICLRQLKKKKFLHLGCLTAVNQTLQISASTVKMPLTHTRQSTCYFRFPPVYTQMMVPAIIGDNDFTVQVTYAR